ncbi:MAG: hypothetical protein ABII07_05645 [Patescibacteria group bacterium]|nr:hypothetical protein [Patescibacteria group bacterium]
MPKKNRFERGYHDEPLDSRFTGAFPGGPPMLGPVERVREALLDPDKEQKKFLELLEEKLKEAGLD